MRIPERVCSRTSHQPPSSHLPPIPSSPLPPSFPPPRFLHDSCTHYHMGMLSLCYSIDASTVATVALLDRSTVALVAEIVVSAICRKKPPKLIKASASSSSPASAEDEEEERAPFLRPRPPREELLDEPWLSAGCEDCAESYGVRSGSSPVGGGSPRGSTSSDRGRSSESLDEASLDLDTLRLGGGCWAEPALRRRSRSFENPEE